MESGKERKYFIDNQTLIGLLGKKFNIYIPMKKNLLFVLLTVLFSPFVQAENYPYRSDVLWVTVPNHADWVYKTGEKATVEVQFYKDFDKLIGDELAILITHRLGAIKFVDNIVVISEGQVEEAGNFHELMRKEGLFYEMYDTQRGYYQ